MITRTGRRVLVVQYANDWLLVDYLDVPPTTSVNAPRDGVVDPDGCRFEDADELKQFRAAHSSSTGNFWELFEVNSKTRTITRR